MRESQVQYNIKEALTGRGWLVIKLIQTSLNGISDLLCLKDKQAVFVEVKTESGRMSDLQIYRKKQIEKLGFEFIVARSLSDVAHL